MARTSKVTTTTVETPTSTTVSINPEQAAPAEPITAAVVEVAVAAPKAVVSLVVAMPRELRDALAAKGKESGKTARDVARETLAQSVGFELVWAKKEPRVKTEKPARKPRMSYTGTPEQIKVAKKAAGKVRRDARKERIAKAIALLEATEEGASK